MLHKKEAELLNVAAVCVGTLLQCTIKLQAVIEYLAQSLNSMYTELEGVIRATKNAEQAVNENEELLSQHFNRVLATGQLVVTRCDTFLETRVSYSRVIRAVRAEEVVTPALRAAWLSKFKAITYHSG